MGSIDRIQGAGSLAVFSYIADDAAIGEERHVDTMANSIGIHPRKIHLDPERLAHELDSLILTQEQPFNTTSIWAQRSVFGRVHQDGFKVVLDGQGADELFAGYPVFRAARLATLIRRGKYLQAIRLLHRMPASSGAPLLQACGSLLPMRAKEVARTIGWSTDHTFLAESLVGGTARRGFATAVCAGRCRHRSQGAAL